MGCIFLPLGFYKLNLIIIMLGAMPLSIGITCLLPLKTPNGYTDGERWRRIRKGGQKKAEEFCLLKMCQKLNINSDYSNVLYSDFEALINSNFNTFKYYGYYYGYKYYEARNDKENMIKFLELLNDLKDIVNKLIVSELKIDD